MNTRLLQMASQVFPIGAYSHSQGLEAAVECGLVWDEGSVLRWISDVLIFSLRSYEVPCLLQMGTAWGEVMPPGGGDRSAAPHHGMRRLMHMNQEFLATRESCELRAATVQMGFSLRALVAILPQLPGTVMDTLRAIPEPSLPCVWSGLAGAWCISPVDSVIAYVWSWAENQVVVAMKSVPIGQSSGQRILLAVGDLIEELDAGPAPYSNFAPGLAILSSRHETQYCRLFRS